MKILIYQQKYSIGKFEKLMFQIMEKVSLKEVNP